jgi:hypothetical protein
MISETRQVAMLHNLTTGWHAYLAETCRGRRVVFVMACRYIVILSAILLNSHDKKLRRMVLCLGHSLPPPSRGLQPAGIMPICKYMQGPAFFDSLHIKKNTPSIIFPASLCNIVDVQKQGKKKDLMPGLYRIFTEVESSSSLSSVSWLWRLELLLCLCEERLRGASSDSSSSSDNSSLLSSLSL